jgi:CRISPR-associated protein Csx16
VTEKDHCMTTYFVTRHPGARTWAAEEGIEVDDVIDHLDPTRIEPGDTVIGSLPVNLAAEVCARGGRYLHLSLDLPADLRGRELTVEQMRACGARLERYLVRRILAGEVVP